MKCVGLFFFVLLVQLFMSPRWRKELHDNDIAAELSQAAERATEIIKNKPHEKLNYDDFRSKLNTTEGIFIPGNLLLTLPLNDASSDVLTAFRGLQQTLTDLSTCPSKIVSSVSTHLFALLDKKANKFGSLSEDGSSLSNVISEVFSSINDVITSLDVGTGINDGVSKIESDLLNVIQVLGEAKYSDSNITKKLNDAVFSVAKSVQVLINSISALAEGATVNVAVSNEAKEAIISLTLILQTTIVFVQSVGLSIASITLSISGRITPASSVLNSFLEILDRQLPLMTNFLSSITSESLATSVSAIVSTLSVTLISVSYRINQLLEKLQTGVLLQVSNKLELTLYRLIGAEADFISYITTSAATVSSSISAISSSDLGIQSKTSRILYALIQNLMQLTGSDREIAENFANSLSGIFEIFKVVSTNIVFAIGAELTNSIIKSIEDVFTALQKMADLLIKDKFDSVKMDNVTIECAKAVQVLGSIVIALTRSISSSMDSVSDVVLESVISLPIIHSTVLYVAEWVTVVASSVSLTKLGQTHDLVSSLAVTIVAILKHISSIVEIIAVSSTQPSIEIFSLILSPILDFTKSMASINRISQVDAKISVKVEASAGKGSDAFVIDGINTAAERTVSEHLNGLTGSLNSISSSFSSSLSNLRISLKRIATLEFGLLQTFSVTLNSVTTNLENISGSATQILNVTFKSLNSIFGRLLDSASKLTNLGSLVSSLVKSIINVSTALHSLRYAINDYRGSICYLNDSIRELAKNVQILISTFVAVIRSSASASSDIIDKLAVEVASLPYLIFTVVLVVQQVLGAAILSASTINGSIPLIQHDLAVALSSVLDSLAFITTEVTVLLTGGSLNEIASKILTAVTDLQDSATASFSKISGVKANIDVTLGLAKQEPVA